MRFLFSDEIKVKSLDNEDLSDDVIEAFCDDIETAWYERTDGFAQQVKALAEKHGVKGGRSGVR